MYLSFSFSPEDELNVHFLFLLSSFEVAFNSCDCRVLEPILVGLVCLHSIFLPLLPSLAQL